MDNLQSTSSLTSGWSGRAAFDPEDKLKAPPEQLQVIAFILNRGLQAERCCLCIKGCCLNEPIDLFKDEVVKELMGAKRLQVRPSSVELLVNGTSAHGDLLFSDYGVWSSNVLLFRVVVSCGKHEPDVDSSIPAIASSQSPLGTDGSPREVPRIDLDLQDIPSASNLAIRTAKPQLIQPPILMRDSTEIFELTPEDESEEAQQGDRIGVYLSCVVFSDLKANKRWCKVLVTPRTTVRQVEERLVELIGLCPTELLIVCRCTTLSSEKTVLSYDVSPGTSLTALVSFD